MAVYGAGPYVVLIEWNSGAKDKHRFGSVESRKRFLDGLKSSVSIKKITEK